MVYKFNLLLAVHLEFIVLINCMAWHGMRQGMFEKIEWFFCLIGILLFTSCSEQHHERKNQFHEWIQDNGKIKVLSTTSMIDDLVKQIGGEQVDTMTLIQ